MLNKPNILIFILLILTILLSCSNNKTDNKFSEKENYYQTPPFEFKSIQAYIYRKSRNLQLM